MFLWWLVLSADAGSTCAGLVERYPEDMRPETTILHYPCYSDRDGDGYGNPFSFRRRAKVEDSADDPDHRTVRETCDAPDQHRASNNLDCDDGDARTHPKAAPEPGGPLDRTCEGGGPNPTHPERLPGWSTGKACNEAKRGYSCWADRDDDGYGDEDGCLLRLRPDAEDGWSMGLSCEVLGLASRAGDCDDKADTVHPGATEVPDGADNDCDKLMLAMETDQDGDGWSPAIGVCEEESAVPLPKGLVCRGGQLLAEVAKTSPSRELRVGDCAEGDGRTWPGAPEAVDGRDTSCRGADLTVANAETSSTWFHDIDGDGTSDPWDTERPELVGPDEVEELAKRVGVTVDTTALLPGLYRVLPCDGQERSAIAKPPAPGWRHRSPGPQPGGWPWGVVAVSVALLVAAAASVETLVVWMDALRTWMKTRGSPTVR